MKNRAWMFSAAVALGTYVSMAGCGDDEVASTPVEDAGRGDSTTTDVQQPDTSVADTSVFDTSVFDTSFTDTSVADAKRGSEQTGQACKVANDCYTGFDAATLSGAAACIDNVTNGYCTHECTQDTDCCAVPGECRTGLKQVCAPFESTGKKFCFLSCDPADIAKAADAGDSGADTGVDASSNGTDYCATQASTDFGCRASGGGAPRKVCLPTSGAGDGGTDASAAADADGG